MKISLFSTLNNPTLGHVLSEFIFRKINVHSIVFDSKDYSMKDSEIWVERTRGEIPLLPLSDFEDKQIPFYFFLSHSSEIVRTFILDNNIDLIVNVGTPRILKSNIISAPKVGVLNCHPGLLPNYRGCTCVEWAIYNDHPIGNTAHLMTEAIDEGPIILKEELTFSKLDKYADIRIKVYKQGFKLIADAVKMMQNGHTNFDFPTGGDYYKVIEESKMEDVLEKINKGQYKYQFDSV